MKLDRLMTCAFAAAAVALACGCSSAPSASAPVKTASAASAMDATLGTTVGTTNLMSAELSGPAPRVGKAHLAVDDDSLDAEQPKEARRSDGSRRGGGFGTSK